MNPLRSLVLTGLFATALGLSGCHKSEAPAGEQTASDSAAAPDAKPGMSAIEGRLVLPVVPGRPGVVYFKVANGSNAAATLAGVHVDGVGKAEMHRTQGGAMTPVDHVDLAPGTAVAFAPGGLHVMAFALSDTLKPGGETEMTLTFAGGDKLSTPIKIETMGMGATGAGSDMAGMHH